MQNTRYAATTWGSNPYTELTVPSGQICLVRKLQPIDLAAGELLGSTDLLAEIVQSRITAAKTGPQDHRKPQVEVQNKIADKLAENLSTALSSSDGLDSMIDMIVIKAVVEPRVEAAPKDFADRVEGTVYVDSIAFADKMYVFNWVMRGIDDLKAFREPSASDVETVESGEGVSLETE